MHNNRWVILATIFVARFSLGFQFQSVGSVSPFLIEYFELDFSQIGTLVGLYMLPGLIVALPGGFIGKRFGDQRVVLTGMGCMVLGGLLSGYADSYSEFALGRILSGAGAVFLFILMTKMVAEWFSDKELFLAMSVFLIGYPVGIATAQITQGPLAEAYTWNLIFYLTAVLSGIAFAFTAVSYHSPPHLSKNASANVTSLSGRELWLVSIAGLIWMLFNAAYLILLSFGPTLLLEQGLSILQSGFAVSLMSWVIILVLPLGGIIADRYKVSGMIMVLGLIGCTIMAAVIPFTTAYLLSFSLLGIAFALATSVIATLPLQVLRPENRAPGLGIYYTWYFVGAAVLPAVGGELRDASGTAANTILFVAAMMFICLCLVGVFRLEQKRLT